MSHVRASITKTVQAIPTDVLDPDKPPVTISFIVQDDNFAHGTFGVVFEAVLQPKKEKVAIKKVLQDPQYRNRELDIIKQLDHPNVVRLIYHFFEKIQNDRFLYLIMEFMADSLYRVIRRLNYRKRYTPVIYVRVVMFQLLRALAYIHSLKICHRDIKPHNILIDPRTGVTKICDFGSSKKIVAGEANVFYICSRFYRSPDLLFGREDYAFEVDVWAVACVMAEMLNNRVLFLGENRADQIAQIINILGTPTREDLEAMNPDYVEMRLPSVPKRDWSSVFHNQVPDDAVSLIDGMLMYKPMERLTAYEALTKEFFRPLRNPDTKLPGSEPLPALFDWSQHEIQSMPANFRDILLKGPK